VNSFRLFLFLLLLFLVATTSLTLGQQSPVTGGNVSLTVTVTDDYGRPIPGLKREQFSVWEKKTSLEITSFEAEAGPASVAFVIDLSGSMSPKAKNLAVQVAEQIRQGISRSSDYLIVKFSETPQVVCGLGCGETEAAKALNDLAQAHAQQNTALYDACDLALKDLEFSKHAKRVVIVFSDGQDNASKLSFSKLRDVLKDSSVTFYAVGILREAEAGWVVLAQEGRGILDELSAVTGGKAYFPRDRKEMLELADVIALQINQHYRLGFKPLLQTPDQKWHPLKLKLEFPRTSAKSPHTHVRYRAGYYSR
jgi:Ca-activated chloride channel family protein